MSVMQYFILYQNKPYRYYIIFLKTLSISCTIFLLHHHYIVFGILVDIVLDMIIFSILYMRLFVFFIKRFIFLQTSVNQLTHDVQNHLTVINLSMQILSEEEDKKNHEKYLLMIDNNIQNIVNLLKSFKNQIVFKLPKFEYVDIVAIIKAFIKDRQDVMKKIKYDVIFDKESIYVYCDIDYINRVIYNIVKNAEESSLDHTKEQKLIKIIVMDSGNKIKIMFVDNGQGFGNSDVKKIFNNFYTTKSYGSGLGMGIVKDLLDFHNGKVYIIPDIDHARVVVELKK